MRVLVIPEDFRKDQYVLKPIVDAMLAEIGKRSSTVRVCNDPLLGGVSQALRWERIAEILARYPMVDLFLLCVDRDGDSHRRARLDNLETKAASVLPAGSRLFAENAWQEVEVWVLAGHDLPAEWNWKDIRAHPNPKEVYFQRLARARKLLDAPGDGRRPLALEAARRYGRIRDLCPEDVASLEGRIRAWLSE